LEGEIADALRDEWGITPRDVVALLSEKPRDRRSRILVSLLSGPIDIDKMDYLARDSLHAGVPYGQHFDRRRLIASLCLNERGDELAITDKGKTAAEMMVFARYVMFSEVYWHHAVRSATAMLQRAVFLLQDMLDPDDLLMMTERPMVDSLLSTAADGPAGELLGGIFGPKRQLYKRLAQYSYFEEPTIYRRLARRPYADHIRIADQIAAVLWTGLRRKVANHEVLVDAPPAELEVDFDIEVYSSRPGRYRRLGDISPVVRTLAQQQFDDYVKRVRIFVVPRIAADAALLPDLNERLSAAIDRTEFQLPTKP
jgi:HD superfamily phosphohydrolase